MTNGLYRLVYYSHNRLPGGPSELPAAIRSILRASRANNAKAGVTGALMFNSGCFAQVLEGERTAIEDTFERIQQDDRHGDVSLLAFDPVNRRAFESWSMAFVGASLEDAARFGEIAQASGFDPSRLTGEDLFETLRRLALEEEAA